MSASAVGTADSVARGFNLGEKNDWPEVLTPGIRSGLQKHISHHILSDDIQAFGYIHF